MQTSSEFTLLDDMKELIIESKEFASDIMKDGLLN